MFFWGCESTDRFHPRVDAPDAILGQALLVGRIVAIAIEDNLEMLL